MKKSVIILTVFLFLICTPFMYSQWAVAIGGKGDDRATCIRQTVSGGMIVAGYTTSFGASSEDAWIFKLNGAAKIKWQKALGSSGSDRACSILQTPGKSYIVAGWIGENDLESLHPDAWVLKLKGNGNIAWQKAHGDINPYEGYSMQAYSAVPSAGGGFVLTGKKREYSVSPAYEQDSLLFLRLRNNGNARWHKIYSDNFFYNQIGYCISQTEDGGYVAAGVKDSKGVQTDFWVLKLDVRGVIHWSHAYGGKRNEYAQAVQQTSDGGYIVTGTTNSYGAGGSDVWVLKLNPKGKIKWQKAYGGKRGDYGHAIQQTADGGYVLAGSTGSYGSGDLDAWVIRLDSKGGILWQKTYGGKEYDSAFSIHPTGTGYIVVGETESYGAGGKDVLVMRLDEQGDIDPSDCAFINISSAVPAGTGSNTFNVATTVSDDEGWRRTIETTCLPRTTNAQVYLICKK